MFLPARFVVVDDNCKHLNAIQDVFQTLGTPCLSVVFDPEHGLDRQHFEGVRGLFLDLHLVDSTVTTDEARHFTTIAGILESCISPTGGPFVLVVWTEHEEYVQGLREYLDESLDPTKPHARPIAITALSKGRFIDIDSGQTPENEANVLRDAVEAALSEKPQLAALLTWEADVVAAAGATISAVMELVPEEQRRSASFASGVDEVLSRLAGAAVGQTHVDDDPRAAITAALAPILSDTIVNQEVLPADMKVWNEAVTWKGKDPLDPVRAGRVNRMLHVAVPASETIRSTDWGAVVEFPDEVDNNALQSLFGVTSGHLLGQEFKIGREDRSDVAPG